jgi:hypothetical protein
MSVEPTEADVGRAVIYTPSAPSWRGARREEGVITSFNPSYVFVRYGADKHPKATRRVDLTWAKP